MILPRPEFARGEEPEISGRDNLGTTALVDAAYRSAKEHRAVALGEVRGRAASV